MEVISKEFFIDIIENIKSQIEHDDECNEILSFVLPNSYVSGHKNDMIYKATYKLLEYMFADNNGWINYFIYELDFGKKYKPGSALYSNGDIINLSSAGELYDFLIKEMTQNSQLL